MAKITILVGVLLIVLGLVAYFVLATGDARSVTALIPAFFGVPLAALGALALGNSRKRRMIVMHIAVVLGLLGAIAPAMRLMKTEDFAKPGPIVQAIMCAICFAFVVMAIMSFIHARRSAS